MPPVSAAGPELWMGPSQLRHLPDHSWAFMAPPPSHNAVLASGGHRALTLVQAESVPARALLLGWGWGLHLGAPARTPLPLPLAPSCPHLCRSHQPSLGTRTHRAMGVHHSPPPLQGQSPSGPGRGPGLTEPHKRKPHTGNPRPTAVLSTRRAVPAFGSLFHGWG